MVPPKEALPDVCARAEYLLLTPSSCRPGPSGSWKSLTLDRARPLYLQGAGRGVRISDM